MDMTPKKQIAAARVFLKADAPRHEDRGMQKYARYKAADFISLKRSVAAKTPSAVRKLPAYKRVMTIMAALAKSPSEAKLLRLMKARTRLAWEAVPYVMRKVRAAR